MSMLTGLFSDARLHADRVILSSAPLGGHVQKRKKHKRERCPCSGGCFRGTHGKRWFKARLACLESSSMIHPGKKMSRTFSFVGFDLFHLDEDSERHAALCGEVNGAVFRQAGLDTLRELVQICLRVGQIVWKAY